MKMLKDKTSDRNSQVQKDAEAQLSFDDVHQFRGLLTALLSLYVPPRLWAELVRKSAEYLGK